MSFSDESLDTIFAYSDVDAEIQKLKDKGVLMVAAAGNSGNNSSGYPASNPNVISVGSINQNEQLSSFSNYGSDLDVVAPGEGICSTIIQNSTLDHLSTCQETSNSNYVSANGTSMAAPYVTGVLALYKQKYPNDSADDIKTKLYFSAKDLGTPGRDDTFGYGLVQAPPLQDSEVGQPLMQDVSNTTVLSKGVSSDGEIYDGGMGWWYSTFYPNSVLLRRFLQPVTVNGFDMTYENGTPLKNVTFTLYDRDMNSLYSQNISDSGVVKFDSVPNVYFVEVKNNGTDVSQIRDLNVLGTYNSNDIPSKNYRSTIDISGVAHNIVKGIGWDDTTKHFKSVLVNMGTDVNPTYEDIVPLRNNIFTEDLTTKFYGQIVKSANVASNGDLFNDEVGAYNGAVFYPSSPDQSSYVDYEFDTPVSISNLYIENAPESLNNHLQVTFFDSHGGNQSLPIGDDELSQRYIDLPNTFTDVKKVRIQNISPDQSIRLNEAAFFGDTPILNPVVYQKPILLKAGDLLVSDDPAHPNESAYHLDSDYLTTISRGYGIKHNDGKFEWIEVTLPDGNRKWINIYHNSIDDNIPNNGLVDTLSAQIVEDVGTWASGWFANNNIYDYPVMNSGGYVRYQFSQPTSVSSLYFKLLNYVDQQSTNFVLTLYDNNQNVLYQRTLSRDDLFNQYIPFDQTISNVSSFKIENDGTENIQIGDFDLFQ